MKRPTRFSSPHPSEQREEVRAKRSAPLQPRMDPKNEDRLTHAEYHGGRTRQKQNWSTRSQPRGHWRPTNYCEKRRMWKHHRYCEHEQNPPPAKLRSLQKSPLLKRMTPHFWTENVKDVEETQKYHVDVEKKKPYAVGKTGGH